MTVLLRTVQYGLSHYPELSKEQHYQRYCEHLQEKYAEGGYLKLWIPESDNASRLAELRALIADEARKREAFEQIYVEERTWKLLVSNNLDLFWKKLHKKPYLANSPKT